ncbi:aldehyde ferredoxin oxidoreductase family protein [Thermodesulfobacteriota bacterium]
MKGYMNKIISIDLTNRKVDIVEPVAADLKNFIGGSGLGTKILCDNQAYLADPLSAENPLIFMTGPFANTPALTSGRHAVLAKSPLTGIFAESDTGGTFGPSLKRSGYDGIVVTGKSEQPVYLWISETNIEICPAAHLWGKDTFETDMMLRSETSEKAVTTCIGPAGEKMVRMASVINDGRASRAAGRCGLGAVMGSKNLKAIAVFGEKKTPIHDRSGLINSLKEITRDVRNNLAGMTQFGSSGGLAAFEELGSLPLKNWKGSGRWQEGAAKITGKTMAERFGTGNYGCEGCVVRCGREIKIDTGPYKGLEGAGPEYETLASLGSLCLVSDLDAIAKGNDLCNRNGIDTISAGAAVAFAMEAFEQGLITEKDTDGLSLTWGNGTAMVNTIQMICENRGLGALLAQGVREAAKTIGGGAEDFAIHSKGLEFPMHDPRTYMSLSIGYATSNRGACHLSGLSHTFERAITMPEIGYKKVHDRLDTQNKGILAANSQNIMGMLDSLKVCKFMLFGGLKITHMNDWYQHITGEKMTVDDFMLTGERIFNLKRLFNLKCGMNPATDDIVPARELELPKDGEGWENRLPPFKEMLQEYYSHRGWNEQGIPGNERLKSLDLT